MRRSSAAAHRDLLFATRQRALMMVRTVNRRTAAVAADDPTGKVFWAE